MYARYLKRWFDSLLSGLLLLVLSPLLLAVVTLIWLEDRAPAIFRQQRVGRGGRPFTIYKFRSMPTGTPNVPSASAQQLRVTRVGKVLRRTNIDELPQLWNVMRGDMSLVGPRPALATQSDLLRLREDAGVMHLRPGLTGLAQVNSYDGMPEAEKVSWERQYAERLAFWRDIAIMCRTFLYLLRRPPTY